MKYASITSAALPIVLLLIALVLYVAGYTTIGGFPIISASNFAAGYIAAGQFSIGVFAAGTLL